MRKTSLWHSFSLASIRFEKETMWCGLELYRRLTLNHRSKNKQSCAMNKSKILYMRRYMFHSLLTIPNNGFIQFFQITWYWELFQFVQLIVKLSTLVGHKHVSIILQTDEDHIDQLIEKINPEFHWDFHLHPILLGIFTRDRPIFCLPISHLCSDINVGRPRCCLFTLSLHTDVNIPLEFQTLAYCFVPI